MISRCWVIYQVGLICKNPSQNQELCQIVPLGINLQFDKFKDLFVKFWDIEGGELKLTLEGYQNWSLEVRNWSTRAWIGHPRRLLVRPVKPVRSDLVNFWFVLDWFGPFLAILLIYNPHGFTIYAIWSMKDQIKKEIYHF